MTKLNRGRAFYATPERLGEYVLVDFVGRHQDRQVTPAGPRSLHGERLYWRRW